MIEKVDTDVAEIGVRLLDDAYLAWFSAESESETALRAWFASSGSQRASMYLTYQAALDREEAAARDLERLWDLADPCREALLHGKQTIR
jgi:hypothetical protein